jgi:hypothetical protein
MDNVFSFGIDGGWSNGAEQKQRIILGDLLINNELCCGFQMARK